MKSMNPYITDVCVLVGQFTALKLKNPFEVYCTKDMLLLASFLLPAGAHHGLLLRTRKECNSWHFKMEVNVK